jgi:carbamoyl-phosphate synthase large subunit
MIPNKKRILLLGSGALQIGQAGEFDYAGTQALKALYEAGHYSILVNPNVASVQTAGLADATYLLPLEARFIEKVIQKERPDAILLAFGGQTALNAGLELERKGILDAYNVEILGTSIDNIELSENRATFKARMQEIGVKVAPSKAAQTIEEAISIGQQIGFPVILRAAYALGGLGSGFAKNESELRQLAEKALAYSPQVLIEKSLKGWKEIEYEVMRDRLGQKISICNMENIDPMGVHTGDSMVVVPSQTLNDQEYQLLRNISLKIAESLEIVGECNVQFALDPNSQEYYVIELNARLSRSSALASKASAYPIAWVATHLALGKGLHEIPNKMNGQTTAFFEPALDYIVCKIPRWDFEQFNKADDRLGSAMKSVGEVMAIGASFEEAFQKALRMLDQGLEGFIPMNLAEVDASDDALTVPRPRRVQALAKALIGGKSIAEIHQLSGIDPWFLAKMQNITKGYFALSLVNLTKKGLWAAKKLGFSDRQIASIHYVGLSLEEGAKRLRQLRKSWQILPVVRQIDSLAGEFPPQNNYLYLSYHGQEHDLHPKSGAILVLGGGTYRIGSSVEFDDSAMQALDGIRELGKTAVLINCNPETVSTDFDSCERLYFEELTLESVLDIADLERPSGLLLSVGGQQPNRLALPLAAAGWPLLGSSAEAIAKAENRSAFSALLEKLGIAQPPWAALTSKESIKTFAQKQPFPWLLRPSYVLAGAAMQVVDSREELEAYLLQHPLSQELPLLATAFFEDAKELELDAIAADGQLYRPAISEHIEPAGVHSGDATVIYPAQLLGKGVERALLGMGQRLAAALEIKGVFNLQCLLRDGQLYVIELNLRASRSMPFVSKVGNLALVKAATQLLLGKEIQTLRKNTAPLIGVKAPQFSFHRLGIAPWLGVRMQATGEVAAIDTSVEDALLKAMLAVGYKYPLQNIWLDAQTWELLSPHDWDKLNANYYSNYLPSSSISPKLSIFISDEMPSLFQEQTLDLCISLKKVDENIRAYAIRHNIPVITNKVLARAFLKAAIHFDLKQTEIRTLN